MPRKPNERSGYRAPQTPAVGSAMVPLRRRAFCVRAAGAAQARADDVLDCTAAVLPVTGRHKDGKEKRATQDASDICLVGAAGLEPAITEEADFESAAYASFATPPSCMCIF